MAREIWVGPVLGAHRARLVDRCKELSAGSSAGPFLYLAASYPLLELVTDLLLDARTPPGVWGTLPVYLFGGLVRHVLATAVEVDTGLPLTGRRAIDREDLPLARSLLSQIVQRLARSGRLEAFAPLAGRDGCIHSLASVIGEIQRAGKTPADFAGIIASRIPETPPSEPEDDRSSREGLPRQIDFDRELAMIYAAYHRALDQFQLTEEDADQLRALAVLRGEAEGRPVTLPWLSSARLLVLDGFFDFTPVQGEMLRLLIPLVPEVIVHLNEDDRNPEIFRPYEDTIDQLRSIATFEIRRQHPRDFVTGGSEDLKVRLFNPGADPILSGPPREDEGVGSPGKAAGQPIQVSLLKCADRTTEIKAIAKEVKRLVLLEAYTLRDIALVVRERASYAEIVHRVFREEGIPLRLEPAVLSTDVTSVRAAVKLLDLLAGERDGGIRQIKMAGLADVLKTGYFRLAGSKIDRLGKEFADRHAEILAESDEPEEAAEERPSAGRDRARRLGVGRWDVDRFENVVAFVGSELHGDDWLRRAQRLVASLSRSRRASSPVDASELEAEDPPSEVAPAEPAVEGADQAEGPNSGSRRPSWREMHPAAIAWTAHVIDHLCGLMNQVPRQASPQSLSGAIFELLEGLQFPNQIMRRMKAPVSQDDLDQAALDLRGLECLRRAFAAASSSMAMGVELLPEEDSLESISPAMLIDEVRRCLRAQVLRISGADAGGLSVLEATDVRGLRFRAIFIAGLVEGGFPLRASTDWIYPHAERERLREFGLTLEDISPATILKEEHYFYQAACRATERLILSRPLALNDGNETIASYLIDEVQRAVAPAAIDVKTVLADYDGLDLPSASTPEQLTVSIVRRTERASHPVVGAAPVSPVEVERLRRWARENGLLTDSVVRRIDIERSRAGTRFGPHDGEVDHPSLLDALRRQYGFEHIFSASELNLYGNCPYKFFAQRVLRLEPRVEAALDLVALEEGQLLHEVLRRFSAAHRGQLWAAWDAEKLRCDLQSFADEVLTEYEERLPPLNSRLWSIEREMLKLMLDQVLVSELELQESRGDRRMLPAYIEWAFGMRTEGCDPASTDEYLEFELPPPAAGGEESVRFRGQIDRVDVAEDGTALAYDYKLARGSSIKDMEAGRDLQMGIYLSAMERLLCPGQPIAGGGYYILRTTGPRRNQGLYRADLKAYTQIGPRPTSSCSEEEWRGIRRKMGQHLINFIRAIRAGEFRVTPSLELKTCGSCDYSALCRYEPYRVRRKLRAGGTSS